MAEDKTPEPSDQEIGDALRKFLLTDIEPVVKVEQQAGANPPLEAKEEEVEEPAAAESVKSTTPEKAGEAVQEEAPEEAEVPAEPEDIASLKQHLADERTAREALRKKASEGLDWARRLALQKSTETERYKGLLKKIQAGEQITQEELERVLTSQVDATPLTQPLQTSMPGTNPFLPAPVQSSTEMSQIDSDQFMIDYDLDEDKAAKLIEWMRSPEAPLTQRDVVPGNPYATLALVYSKFEKAQAAKSNITAKALASVARTQKEAAKAAGTLSARARPSPPADIATAPKELTDDQVRELVRRSVTS